MKHWFQYAMVLALVASMAASSQAEICPMELQSGRPQQCKMSMPAHRPAAKTASGHDCCPKGATTHPAARPQCPPREISACMSAMTCCSLTPQPQSLSQVFAVEQPITLGSLNPPLLPPSRAGLFQATPLATPENPVFRLKVDLRI